MFLMNHGGLQLLAMGLNGTKAMIQRQVASTLVDVDTNINVQTFDINSDEFKQIHAEEFRILWSK